MYDVDNNKLVDSDTEVFYTPNDVMNILKISKWKVYKLFAANGFPAIRIGGSLRISKSKFIKWCNQYAGQSFSL